MTLPPGGEVGVGVVGGGAVVAFALKVIPILLRKFNGKKIENKNTVKPGFGKECIKQGKKIVEHDQAILGICSNVTKIEKQMEVARTENREDHGKMFEKLDSLRK